MVLNLGLKV